MTILHIISIITIIFLLWWKDDNLTGMELKRKIGEIEKTSLFFSKCVNPVVVGKKWSHLPNAEENGAQRYPDHEVCDVVVGDVFFWLGHPQQTGQEIVALINFIT